MLDSHTQTSQYLNKIDIHMQQKELSVVSLLQKDSTQGFSQSMYFKGAMEEIRQLYHSHFVCLATVFDDMNNDEIRFCIYTNIQGNLQKTILTVDKEDSEDNAILKYCKEPYKKYVYEFVQDLMDLVSFAKIPIKLDDIELLKMNSNETIKNSTCHYNFFNSDKGLTGWLIHDTQERHFIVDSFKTLSVTLENILSQVHKNTLAENKIRTYQQVLDLMPQRVFWKNRNSVYLGANLAFAKDASKTSTGQLKGVTDFDIFPEQATLYRADDSNTMLSKQHLINSEEPQTHANGQTIWLRTSKRPIIDEHDNVIGVVGTYDEITDLKNTQAQLQEAKEELEIRVEQRTQELSSTLDELKKTQNHMIESEKMAALGGLVAGVAHEINTPLGISVTGASHLDEVVKNLKNDYEQRTLKKSALSQYCETISDASNIILTNLHRAASLIDNFKLIAVDQSKDEARVLKMDTYIKSILNTLSPKLKNKDIQIHTDIESSCEAITYPGAMSQLITNLVDNSINHAFDQSQQGEINIKVKENDDKINILYQDNGKGISQELINKIYEPFFTTKRGLGGSGLGMHIVYNLITVQLKGSIQCESELNQGVKFEIQIAKNVNQ